jgi:hypothetical protein
MRGSSAEVTARERAGRGSPAEVAARDREGRGTPRAKEDARRTRKVLDQWGGKEKLGWEET